MNVENMTSSNGDPVASQFIIRNDTRTETVFQSYQSRIVKIVYGKTRQVYLDRNKWDCCKITGKYRNQFLNETKRETEAKIKSGEYVLTDLN